MTDIASTRTDLTGVAAVLGTATTVKTAGVASFTINGGVVQCQVARDLTIAAGDVCLIQRVGSQWFALQRLYTAAPAAVENPDVPPAKPYLAVGTLVVAPTETRSYNATTGWRLDVDDVIQGNYNSHGNHTGAAFYGAAPASLTGATVTSASVQILRPARGGPPAATAVTMRLITETARPAGAPTLGASTAGPSLRWGDQSMFAIPPSWAQSMVDGTAGGLGVFVAGGTPYVVLAGRADYSPSFALTINWQR